MKNFLKDKTILITGGAGFIGSNLCDHFIQHNTVICADNLSTGKRGNIEHLMSNDRFKFVEMDLRNFDDCLDISKGVDIILHQAALGSVPRSIKTPLETNSNNVTGFLNIIEAARLNSVGRFVFATSSSVYGDHPSLPKEEGVIGNPLSPYAVTKHVNELYANVYGQLYNMEVIGLRYFNVYGPKQDPKGAYAAVIPRFMNNIIDGLPIHVNGDGSQTRDFTYVRDVIQANELAASTTNKEAFNTIFNVSYGNSISLNDLIETMNSCISTVDRAREIAVEYGPKRLGDIEHSFASIDKIKTLLNYQPAYPLKDGLVNYLEYLLATRSATGNKISN